MQITKLSFLKTFSRIRRTVTIEGLPVDVLGRRGVSSRIVMKLDPLGKIIFENFSQEYAIREIAGKVLFGFGKSIRVDPVQK